VVFDKSTAAEPKSRQAMPAAVDMYFIVAEAGKLSVVVAKHTSDRLGVLDKKQPALDHTTRVAAGANPALEIYQEVGEFSIWQLVPEFW
jgi:hypothetical protein